MDEDAGQHVGCGDEDVVGLAVNKADGLTVLRHMELLAQFNAWAAARSSRNDSVLDTSRIPRAQRKPVDELTHRPLSKAVRPVNKARILLLGSDCTRLRGEAWLTDEVMNSFAALINHRSRAAALGEGGLSPRRHSAPLRTFMFNTFFFSRLSARIGHVDYDVVRRWGVKLGLSLLAVHVILVPIVVQRTHRVLVTIDVVRRQFHYYDSLSAEDVRGVTRLPSGMSACGTRCSPATYLGNRTVAAVASLCWQPPIASLLEHRSLSLSETSRSCAAALLSPFFLTTWTTASTSLIQPQ